MDEFLHDIMLAACVVADGGIVIAGALCNGIHRIIILKMLIISILCFFVTCFLHAGHKCPSIGLDRTPVKQILLTRQANHDA